MTTTAAAVRLPAVLTHNTAPEVMAQAQRTLLAEPSKSWMLDAGALDQFDSSALAVLLGLRRCAQESGAELHIEAAPARLGQLASLYGVADLLHLSAR